MQTFRHLSKIAVTPPTEERAREIGGMAYMQWLGNLPGSAGYAREAERALRATDDLGATAPAVAALRAILQASLDEPLRPLIVAPPKAQRRGGARSRRARR